MKDLETMHSVTFFHHITLHCSTLRSLKTVTEDVLQSSVLHFLKPLPALFENLVFSRSTISCSTKRQSTAHSAFPTPAKVHLIDDLHVMSILPLSIHLFCSTTAHVYGAVFSCSPVLK